jgi:murein DD-endopeptidase MepM/ murein hydrolase activator NlpD
LLSLIFLLGGCLGAPRKRPDVSFRPSSGEVVFHYPLSGAKILSKFGPRGRRFHEGIDLQVSRRGGDPILAAADGVVVDVRNHRGYGRQVLIQHANGWFTRYAHMRAVHVRQGARVKRGAKLGLVGQSGRASCPHLHFEILTPDRRPVDPKAYLK